MHSSLSGSHVQEARRLSLAWLHNEFHTKGQPDGVERTTISRGPAGIITHNAERFCMNYVFRF
ncbi:hypothetical protein Pres01_34370 [Metapseudomonas resinovorans]|nr:hypothetical protein Pres01_34370 [Pseudomonas resinovorans]